jgi:AraC-like DNA-binding protein
VSQIVALTLDRKARARIVEGTRGLADVHFCDTVVEVPCVVRRGRVAVVILEPRDREGLPTDSLIAALRRDFPPIPVLAYCEATQGASADILAAARAGASGLLLRGHDDVGAALRSALAVAGDNCAARHILQEVNAVLPPTVRLIVEHCLLHGRERLTVSAVARSLGVHRKTLVNRLASANLPGPRTIIGWSRLLLVAHALEELGRPVERVALDFEFPSSAALCSMLKRYTGLRPAEVREQGGLACMLQLFKHSLLGTKDGA